MPLELQIIRAREFVRLGAEGQFDFESTRAVLETLADACCKRGIERALLDVRESSSNLTPNDLAALVNAFTEVGFSKRLRLAVLHGGDQEYRARLFAFIGKLRGWKVQTFEDYEQALEWLSVALESAPEQEGEIVPVQIKESANEQQPGITRLNI
ncbi:MAG TPA: hypothetical protein VNT99_02410 [Methylomirabilota bacterium]|nr:hypothetical protein [Methylomirabilota bacterium]